MDDFGVMDLFPQITTVENAPPTSVSLAVERALKDRARLREIAALRLTDSDIGPLLSELCEEACQKLKLPIGLVTIVLDEAQQFAAHHGLGGWLADAGGTPVEWSFCRFPVASKEMFVVEDAQQNQLVNESPLVTQDGLRCYAGIPLISSRGHALGSLCVAGAEARTFTADELQQLGSIADEAIRRLEARRGNLRTTDTDA